MEQLVARQAHNLEVVRSSRAPATKGQQFLLSFFVYGQPSDRLLNEFSEHGIATEELAIA